MAAIFVPALRSNIQGVVNRQMIVVTEDQFEHHFTFINIKVKATTTLLQIQSSENCFCVKLRKMGEKD